MKEFEDLVKEVKESESKSKKIRISTLLSYFGVRKRGKNVNSRIRKAFDENGLFLDSKFKDYYNSTLIEIKLKNIVDSATQNYESAVSTPTISILEAANTVPLTVIRDNPINQATGLMMMHDYSQLPVMQGERKVDGVVSWKSIGEVIAAGKECKNVKDCIDKDIQIVDYDIPLLKAIKIINKEEFVLVKSKSGKICGLVTTTDVSQQFIGIAEPFLLLEQLENKIRILIDRNLSPEQLKDCKYEKDEDRNVNGVADLTFGEYLRAFESPEYWDLISLKIDKSTFVKRLHEVRIIRNDVMHFHPDGIDDEKVEVLRKTNNFLSKLL